MSADEERQRNAEALRVYEMVQKRADWRYVDAVINGATERLTRPGITLPEDIAKLNGMIDRALSAERRAHSRATAASGGAAKGELVDQDALSDLERHTEGGDWRADPAYILERQEEEDEAATARAEVLAATEHSVHQSLDAYSSTLGLAHRKALELIRSDPKLTNRAIAATIKKQTVRGIREQTVAKLRERYNAIAQPLLVLKGDRRALENLWRRVEAMEMERTARRAERRRDEFLKAHTVEEYEGFRKFAAVFNQFTEASVDTLFAAAVRGPSAET